MILPFHGLVCVLPLLLVQDSAHEARRQEAVPDAIRERIEERCLELLWRLHGERAFPGACAALVLPDGSGIDLPVGYADVESEREMTAADRMLSGSIGKTYVTAAVHKLMLEGKLSFDQRAIEFFEGEEWFERLPNGNSVTVRQLLRHQSGIPRHIFQPGFLPACFAEPDKVWMPRELLSFVFDLEPLFDAGEGWAYADTNYILLGSIVERSAGTSFYSYVKSSFLQPIGLCDTVPSDRRRISGLAQGYLVLFKGEGLPERVLGGGEFFCNPQFEWCGGGYANTAMDLARWARALYSGEAMEGDYLTSMLDTVPSRLGPGIEYGCGVMVRQTKLGPQLGHDGVMFGYSGTMSYLPEVEIAVSLLLNTDDTGALGRPLEDVTLELAWIASEELKR